MFLSRGGSFRIFRFAGIDVFLHWTWFILPLLELQARQTEYPSLGWNVAELVALFAIVTLHEFGHALACRSVGGTADQIVLWPLGGVAYVNPPQRPGPVLWSIVAGPLVNVLLVPVLAAAYFAGKSGGLAAASPQILLLVLNLNLMNAALLVFNMLPVFPLDGGQILRALLWFVVGRAKSLLFASLFGFLGVAGLLGLALWLRSPWLVFIAIMAASRCVTGFKLSRVLMELEGAPRRPEFACPVCRQSPTAGKFWGCSACGLSFDTFEALAVCPNCRSRFTTTRCLECGAAKPILEWVVPVGVEGTAKD